MIAIEQGQRHAQPKAILVRRIGSLGSLHRRVRPDRHIGHPECPRQFQIRVLLGHGSCLGQDIRTRLQRVRLQGFQGQRAGLVLKVARHIQRDRGFEAEQAFESVLRRQIVLGGRDDLVLEVHQLYPQLD